MGGGMRQGERQLARLLTHAPVCAAQRAARARREDGDDVMAAHGEKTGHGRGSEVATAAEWVVAGEVA